MYILVCIVRPLIERKKMDFVLIKTTIFVYLKLFVFFFLWMIVSESFFERCVWGISSGKKAFFVSI